MLRKSQWKSFIQKTSREHCFSQLMAFSTLKLSTLAVLVTINILAPKLNLELNVEKDHHSFIVCQEQKENVALRRLHFPFAVIETQTIRRKHFASGPKKLDEINIESFKRHLFGRKYAFDPHRYIM